MLRNRASSLAFILLALFLSACGKSRVEIAAPTPPPAIALPPPAMPRPPMNAATNLTLPIPGPDGRYPTPNRALSSQATAWHLRAALNVAVLQCAKVGSPMEGQYNAFLAAHKVALARAHKDLEAEYKKAGGRDWQDRFDDEMTRLYNFYAQPPARDAFCRAAAPLTAAAATTPPGGLDAFAATALPTLDVPFTDFYREYAEYRRELAAWQAEYGVRQSAAARITTVPLPASTSAPTAVD